MLEPAALLEGEIGARPHPSPTSRGVGLMPFILANRGVAGIGIAAEGVGGKERSMGRFRGGEGGQKKMRKREKKNGRKPEGSMDEQEGGWKGGD